MKQRNTSTSIAPISCSSEPCTSLDRRELQNLARDFKLNRNPEVKKIIQEAKTYSDGQRAILKLYDQVYMAARKS